MVHNTILGVKLLYTNSSTTPTFSPDGLTAKSVVNTTGGAILVGQLVANTAVLLRYDEASDKWWLVQGATAGVNNDITQLNTLSGGLGGSAFSFRNRIINGDMRIDQRNSGNSHTVTNGSAVYGVDRWYNYTAGANCTAQRILGLGAFEHGYKFTGAASVSLIHLGQRIEATNCGLLANTVVTLSAYLSNSLLTTVNWVVAYANTKDVFSATTSIASGSFTVNSTSTRYSTQISLPANAANGLQIYFTVGAQTSGIWDITGVQLEAGSVATPFEHRPVGTELALCQRYYQIVTCGYSDHFASIAERYVMFSWPVTMRLAPTVTSSTNEAEFNVSTFTLALITIRGCRITITATASNTLYSNRNMFLVSEL